MTLLEWEKNKVIRAGKVFLLQFADSKGLRWGDNLVLRLHCLVSTLSQLQLRQPEKKGTNQRGGAGMPYFFMRR